MHRIATLFFACTLFFSACNTPVEEAPPVGLLADSAMVVSAHPLASEVGADILKQGGNAVDAAVAVQFALAVVYPVAGNIGGGGFMVSRMHDGELSALDFRERAPFSGGRDMYLDSLGEVIPKSSTLGHLAAGVPGSVAGMYTAHQRYGTLPWEQLVQPAIDLAANGFLLTEKEARSYNSHRERFLEANTVAPAFLLNESGWNPGDSVVMKDLAWTLTQVRDMGAEGFYTGEVAKKIVAEMVRGNGMISLDDLAEYEAVWRDPVVFSYRGHRIISMPPASSGGIALAQLLQMVESYPLADWEPHSAEKVHLFTEAERRVYADRSTHLGDTDFYPVPRESLIDAAYATQRMASFDAEQATDSEDIASGEFSGPKSEETTHFSIVDAQGNAVSITTTLNGGMGSHVVVDGAGFLLNNEMDDFSIKPGYPNAYGLIGAEANAIEPGKRMLSSMTPTIIEKDGQLKMVVGTPGGSTIITSVFQTIVNVLDHGMGMQEAVAYPRFHHQWKPNLVYHEVDAIPSEIRNALQNMGHTLQERGGIGRVDAILILEDGKLEGGADPRGDDMAAGY